MRTAIYSFLLFSLLHTLSVHAQDRTTVKATSSEISDNLDLRAIASIFGDARDLEDFERRLNDPKSQISNLDLNEDNQVDYLRVVESVEGNVHLIIVQAVLGLDNYQDVATIEVEKDNNNRIQVQVVGDVFMYGQNYIYEPIYVSTPIIYNTFWLPAYSPYCSVWYWNYYPTFYYAWTPFPVFRYRNHIRTHINIHHHYNYVNVRRCQRAIALHQVRRSNYLERTAPNRSFAARNATVTNRYELDQVRKVKVAPTRVNSQSNTTRNNVSRSNTRASQEVRPTRNNWKSTKTNYANTRSTHTQIKDPRTTRNTDVRQNNVRNQNQNTIRETRTENAIKVRTSPTNSSNNTRENNAVTERVRPSRNENQNVRNNGGVDRSSEIRVKQSSRTNDGSRTRETNNTGRTHNNTSRRE